MRGGEIRGQFRTRALQRDIDTGSAVSLGRRFQGRQAAGTTQAGRIEGQIGGGAAGRIVDMAVEIERAGARALAGEIGALHRDVEPARREHWDRP